MFSSPLMRFRPPIPTSRDLSKNQLSGTIATEIGTMKAMEQL